MYFPDPNNIVASWQGKHILHAVKEAQGTVFCLECKGVEASLYRPIREVRGWVSPDSIQEKKRAQFYQMLRPLFNSDQSSVVFALFVKKIYGEVRGKVVGILEKGTFLENKGISLKNERISIEFFPKEGPSFLIRQTEGLFIPEYYDVVGLSSYWMWVKEHIDACSAVSLKDGCLLFQSITSHIVVRMPTSERRVIQTEMHVLVKHIIEEIEKIEGIPPDKQRLIIDRGKQLNIDEFTLADQGVRSGSQVNVVIRLRGGGLDLTPFNKIDDLIRKSGNFLVIRSGLNLEGKCNNEKCEKSGQVIWMWKGFGVFNMSKECMTSTCPECKEIAIDVNNCGFTRCMYSIEGETQSGEKREWRNIRAPDDDLLTYDSGSPLQKWRKLIITTMPVPMPSSAPELPINSLPSSEDFTHPTSPLIREGRNCSGCTLL